MLPIIGRVIDHVACQAWLNRCKRRYQKSSLPNSYFCCDTFAMALGLTNEINSDKVELTSVRDLHSRSQLEDSDVANLSLV